MFPLATQMLDGRPNFLCSGFSCFQKTFFKKKTFLVSLKRQPRKKNQKCIIYVSNLRLKNVSKAV